MGARAWGIAALVALLASGVGAAAVIVVPPVPEQLVEGHTVWAVIERAPTGEAGDHFAAAVAVLVREVRQEDLAARFPGVLWFNDQYLVNPFAEETDGPPIERFPCTGAVLAVPRGGADPRAEGLAAFSNDTYVESYLVTDPNDRAWHVDRWQLASGPVWTVAIMDDQVGYSTPDDGACEGQAAGSASCAGGLGATPAGCHPFLRGIHVEGVTPQAGRNPGAHGMGYPCGEAGASCEPVRYNAVLYFLLSDLPAAGTAPKNHDPDEPTSDWWVDVAACHAYSEPWPCPDQDDNREGNSHPYHPGGVLQHYDGAGNHGGSASCDGTGELQQECHATREIDVYFGVATAPYQRTFRVLDLQGSAAPYHCHDEAMCGALGISP